MQEEEEEEEQEQQQQQQQQLQQHAAVTAVTISAVETESGLAATIGDLGDAADADHAAAGSAAARVGSGKENRTPVAGAAGAGDGLSRNVRFSNDESLEDVRTMSPNGMAAQYVFDAVCCVYTCRRLIDLSLVAGTLPSRTSRGVLQQQLVLSHRRSRSCLIMWRISMRWPRWI